MRRIVLMVAILALWAPLASADRTVSSEKRVKVCLDPYKPTSIQYPEPVLRVQALELPDRYTFEAVGVYLYLTAKQPDVDSRLFVIGQLGQQYQVDFSVCTPADVIVRVVRPQTQTKAQPFSYASWFRALRFNESIPGQQAADVPLPHVPDGRLVITTGGAVSRGSTIGMVLQAQNTTDQPLVLDERIGEVARPVRDEAVRLSQWGWPPKLTVEAIALEDKRVQPGQTTRIYVLFEKR